MNSPPSYLKSHSDGVVVQVKVVPRSSRNQICEPLGDRLKIRIAAPPVDSAANHELIRFLSKTTGVSKSQVLLIQGQANRSKNVLIRGLKISDAAAVLAG